MGLKVRLLVYVVSIFKFIPTCFGQASLTTTYSQNFGTTSIGSGSFVSNSTFLGWYLENDAKFLGTVNITAAAPTNIGGSYAYTCNGGTDIKLGTRPSNGSGGAVCDGTPTTCGHKIGLRLVNNNAYPIKSVNVAFDWYQLSLAQNGGNANPMIFEYKTGTTVTSLPFSSVGWTAVSALDFTAPQSSAVSGGGMINGYPCNQTGNNSACFDVTIPAGEEIMFRWSDPNNSANDPHLAIDNVVVDAYSGTGCIMIVSIVPNSFQANIVKGKVELKWLEDPHKISKSYEVQKSMDGIIFEKVECLITEVDNGKPSAFYANDLWIPDSYPIYYRLKTTEFDNTFSYSRIVSVSDKNNESISVFPNPVSDFLFIENFSLELSTDNIQLQDISGKYFPIELVDNKINFTSVPSGTWILSIETSEGYQYFRVIKE